MALNSWTIVNYLKLNILFSEKVLIGLISKHLALIMNLATLLKNSCCISWQDIFRIELLRQEWSQYLAIVLPINIFLNTWKIVHLMKSNQLRLKLRCRGWGLLWQVAHLKWIGFKIIFLQCCIALLEALAVSEKKFGLKKVKVLRSSALFWRRSPFKISLRDNNGRSQR